MNTRSYTVWREKDCGTGSLVMSHKDIPRIALLSTRLKCTDTPNATTGSGVRPSSMIPCLDTQLHVWFPRHQRKEFFAMVCQEQGIQIIPEFLPRTFCHWQKISLLDMQLTMEFRDVKTMFNESVKIHITLEAFRAPYFCYTLHVTLRHSLDGYPVEHGHHV